VEKKRETWSWRGAFVFAVIGSAVGLGNAWRFPYVVAQNGGGAFFIPYLFALLTAGIPLMMLEFGIGHKYLGAPPIAYGRAKKDAEMVGWWGVGAAFVIITYYGVVMAWAINYLYHAFTLAWGTDTTSFFLFDFLKLSDGPGILGSLNMPILAAYVIGWILICWIIYSGVKGLGKVVMVTATLPVVILIILALRGLTLNGAMAGLDYYLSPNFAALGNVKVWMAAYGQVFFSLSLGMAVLIAYASYLPKDAEISNNVFIASLADAGIAFLAGFAIFSTVGYMAAERGTTVAEVAGGGGIGLAFFVYPQAINLLPGATFFGILFFLLLVTLAVDSQFSLVEGIVGSVMDKWNMKRGTALACVAIPGFLIGLVYVTSGGLYWLDIIDKFVNSYGLVAVGLAQCIVVGWIIGPDKIREHVNALSEIKVGKWFDFFIKYLTPVVLIYILISSLITDLKVPYEGYPGWALNVGWAMVVLLPVGSFLLSKLKTSKETEAAYSEETNISA
jgi:NSS family neurotransmitter:Na+ symporter